MLILHSTISKKEEKQSSRISSGTPNTGTLEPKFGSLPFPFLQGIMETCMGGWGF